MAMAGHIPQPAEETSNHQNWKKWGFVVTELAQKSAALLLQDIGVGVNIFV